MKFVLIGLLISFFPFTLAEGINVMSLDMNINAPLKAFYILDAANESISVKIAATNHGAKNMSTTFDLYLQKAGENPKFVQSWNYNIGPRQTRTVDSTPSPITNANYDHGAYTYFAKITSYEPVPASEKPIETILVDNSDSASFVVKSRKNIVPEIGMPEVFLLVFGVLSVLLLHTGPHKNIK